jgi:N utilization substance protein B
MGTRRHARELAMQALFSMDMSGLFSAEQLDAYRRCFPPNKHVAPFFERLADGVLHHRDRIDDVIERYSSNWKVRRMACVDRNVLRLAVFELLFCGDIPAKVSINEAIDIAKKFGSSESGSFVNGILDSISNALDRKELSPILLPPADEPTEAEAAEAQHKKG